MKKKYIVIVPDGASDYPIDILGKRTPLEVAETPYMDTLAKEGILGRVRTVPSGFTPSSDIANLSLLGYEPQRYYTGRGPLEAVNLGVELEEGDLAFRCNLVTEYQGRLTDYSAGHISDQEARILIEYLDKELGTKEIKFFPGKSYRHLILFKKGESLNLDKLKYAPPHDIMGEEVGKHLPQGENSQIIVDLIYRSRKLLARHEVNKVRVDLGENPGNMIWLWGCGRKPRMETFEEKFGLKGAIISAVDLLKGIGKILGFKVIEIEGATGYYDTNYQGKAQGALEALKEVDFVFLHIEATDEAGHNGDLRMKIVCLERIDKLVVGTILKGIGQENVQILIVPDHPTPISQRTHTDEPVPFLIWGKEERGNFSGFSELEAQRSFLFFERGIDLLNYFLNSSFETKKVKA